MNTQKVSREKAKKNTVYVHFRDLVEGTKDETNKEKENEGKPQNVTTVSSRPQRTAVQQKFSTF